MFCCHLIANAITVLIVSSLLKPLSIFFQQKETKVVLYCIMLPVIPIGLALLYRYCFLTLQHILGLVVFIIFDIFFSFVLRNHFMQFILLLIFKTCLISHCGIIFLRNKVYLLNYFLLSDKNTKRTNFLKKNCSHYSEW